VTEPERIQRETASVRFGEELSSQGVERPTWQRVGSIGLFGLSVVLAVLAWVQAWPALARAGLSVLALVCFHFAVEFERRSANERRLLERLRRVEAERGELRVVAGRAAMLEKELAERGQEAEHEAMYRAVLENTADQVMLEERERALTVEAMVEASRDWIWATDVQGRITFCNPAVREILGFYPEELVGRDLLERVHEEDRPALQDLLDEWTAEGKGWSTLLVRWIHRDGEVRFLESSAVPNMDIDGTLKGFRGVDRDVTERIAAEEERRRLEQQIRQGQKLEAIGALAGGVAHDFNNILQAILATASMARLKSPIESPAMDEIKQIESAAQKAADLTRQLLAFSRQQVLQRRSVSLSALVVDFLRMLRRVIGEDVTIILDSTEDAMVVRADPGQLEQVILNLCVNARDAMLEGGEIRIATKIVYLDSAFASTHPGIQPGQFVRLTVSDSGHGMDRPTIERIFDPFFTTKPVGKGTGLGLSTVYGIIKQHGGAIDVQSEVGRGTTFLVYIPRHDGPVEQRQGNSTQPAPNGTELVLLAEDDQLVRTLAVRILESAGYRVLAARDGEEAIALAKLHKEDIKLLLLDVVMPRCGGPAVEAQVRGFMSHAKVLFTTGFAAGERHARFDGSRHFELLTKPYTRAVLLTRVREVLDAPDDAPVSSSPS
jgi:two-component system cell cycle sensor histidine kinase/response regulator CckA